MADAEPDTTARDPEAMARRLGRALAIPTITAADRDRMDTAAFTALGEYLQAAFPSVHAKLRRDGIGDHHALLYTWRGSDAAAEPWLLVSHQDVVGVERGTEADWTHPPFSGAVAGGFVWGRGAIDLKVTIFAAMEAVEGLLAQGFSPRRSVYLAFGADEEVGGEAGAALIARVLEERGVSLAFTLDEGGLILSGALPGIASPVALIGTAEKGELTLRLRVRDTGGHSSMPPRRTAIGRLAAALAEIDSHPMPAAVVSPTRDMFAGLARHAGQPFRTVYGNLWLTAPLLARLLERQPAGNAALRTTAAATMVRGGTAETVMPQAAEAAVNFRLRPGDRARDVADRVRRRVGRLGVDVEVASAHEASHVSRCDSLAFKALVDTIAAVFPDVVTAPCLTLNSTDSRHYARIARDQYRFVPIRATPEDLARIHGTDERIAIADYADAVRFFAEFIRAADRS